MKWIWVILLAIIGILAAIVAVEYLTVSIHALPSWIPGHHAQRRGHYHKRGAGAALVALIAFVAAGYLAYRFSRSGTGGVSPTTTSDAPIGPADASSAGQLLTNEPPAAGSSTAE